MSDARSRGQRLLDQALGTVIGVLVIGFFAILWNGGERFDRSISDLTMKIEKLFMRVDAAGQVFSEQLAQLRVRDDRTVALSEALARCESAIEGLKRQFAEAINQPIESLDLPAINAPAPVGQFPQKAFEVQQSIQADVRERSK
jgi:hypothetical protein